MLKDIFTALINRYTRKPGISDKLWSEIENHYTGSKRHYHNLLHLQNMYMHLEACRDLIHDRDTVLFSLFYHDIIYKATSKDNEEKSALAAKKALTLINYPTERIMLCAEQIMATKSHSQSTDSDTNLFIDADMSILGASPDDYNTYSKNVRKEYSIFPDFMYNPGRKKVLEHFLGMENIFKTLHFRDMLEVQARKNILFELSQIS